MSLLQRNPSSRPSNDNHNKNQDEGAAFITLNLFSTTSQKISNLEERFSSFSRNAGKDIEDIRLNCECIQNIRYDQFVLFVRKMNFILIL